MALFPIQRYTGEEIQEEVKSPQNHVTDILKKLHEQAKQKQQQSPLTKKSQRENKKSPNKRLKKKLQPDELDNATSQDSPVSKKARKHASSDRTVEDTDGLSPEGKSSRPDRKVKQLAHNEVKHDKDSKKHISVSEVGSSSESGQPSNLVMKQNDKDDSDSEDNDEDEDAPEPDTDHQQTHQEVGGFTVIGGVGDKKKQKVTRMLPDWLANPLVITNDLNNELSPVEKLAGLEEDMKSKMVKNGFTHIFPVQRQVIPLLLDSSTKRSDLGLASFCPPDICCSAPTGSGKTLTFVIPIVQALKDRVVCHVRALVVLPVRDLAAQVYRVFQMFCQDTKLKVGLVTGQKSFSSEQQALVRKGPCGLHSLVDIVVATPGRLVDHIDKTKGFHLNHLRYLVVDEADRMMDEIKQDWLANVERAVYTKGRAQPGILTANNASQHQIPLQKLLFSATLSQNPEKLQQLNLFLPRLCTSVEKSTSIGTYLEKKGEFVGKYTTPANLKEYFVESTPGEKPLLVLYFMLILKFKHILCFTGTKEATHRLFLLLKLFGGIEVKEFSSGLPSTHRDRILKQFAAGKIDVLICTDAIARGIDIDNVHCVISYENPPFLKTYIHRIGRTARAGKAGTAITLLEKSQIVFFKRMVAEAGKKKVQELRVQGSKLTPLVERYQETLKELPHHLQSGKRRKR